ncbi:MAG: Uma2 family endonuclease [Acidobacteriota bacterium]|nr:Uma2 family endonuclease [Acidobacteriota bacterium]
MSTQAVAHLSLEKYLELERRAKERSEYLNGQMFAMAGGTRNHARIVGNTLSQLVEQLRGRPCEAAGGDLRLYSAAHDIFIYPDVVVTCGPDKFLDNRRDTITDATLIVEVLSPSTRSYDRGEKFLFYRSLPSFSEYLLLAQDTILAEHHVRQPDGAWLFREFKSPADEIELTSIGCRLKLESLYERVEFEAPPTV